MVDKFIRGRIIGFQKQRPHDATHSNTTKVILEIEVESIRDATLWAFVVAQPEVTVSILDELEKDR